MTEWRYGTSSQVRECGWCRAVIQEGERITGNGSVFFCPSCSEGADKPLTPWWGD